MKPGTPATGPVSIQAAYQQAVRLHNAGQLQRAAQIYQSILAQRELAEPAYQMGRIAAATGRRSEAATWFRRALRLKPAQREIWLALLDCLDGKERAAALQEARARGALPPEKAATLMRKGAEEVAAGRLRKARKTYLDAISAGADAAELHEQWAMALYNHGHAEDALQVVSNGMQKTPDAANLAFLRSSILETLGRLDDAEADLLRGLERKPYQAAAWNSLMRLRKQEPDSPHVAMLETRIREAESDPEAVRMMSFALAKGLEDQGRYDEVFRHLDRGNAMTRAKFPWGFSSDHDFLTRAIAAWEPVPGGYEGDAPIFVTGLPRSGTTLVETILGAHSKVVAGGEAGVLTPILKEPLAAWMNDGAPYATEALGRSYVQAMRRKLGVTDPAVRTTDKSISTYSSIGYALNLLPRAKFVVLDRDRRDVALSIYKNKFPDGLHRYAYDLGDIARQIRLFDGAIAAWKKRVPEAIHVIDYQALTEEPEPHIRALLEFCDLDWEDACLTPERTSRQVFTLSSVQVRQPINRGSVDAWKRFESDLEPLIAGLAEPAFDFG